MIKTRPLLIHNLIGFRDPEPPPWPFILSLLFFFYILFTVLARVPDPLLHVTMSNSSCDKVCKLRYLIGGLLIFPV